MRKKAIGTHRAFLAARNLNTYISISMREHFSCSAACTASLHLETASLTSRGSDASCCELPIKLPIRNEVLVIRLLFP